MFCKSAVHSSLWDGRATRRKAGELEPMIDDDQLTIETRTGKKQQSFGLLWCETQEKRNLFSHGGPRWLTFQNSKTHQTGTMAHEQEQRAKARKMRDDILLRP